VREQSTAFLPADCCDVRVMAFGAARYVPHTCGTVNHNDYTVTTKRSVLPSGEDEDGTTTRGFSKSRAGEPFSERVPRLSINIEEILSRAHGDFEE